MPDDHLTSQTPEPSTSPSTTRHATSELGAGPDSPAVSGPPTSSPLTAPADGRSETELERYDRNLTELMGELRVALPGVQVLFAFLLVIPFNNRFSMTTPVERRLYFATLLLTVLASMLLIAPTVLHRLTFRMGAKPYIVQVGNRLTIAGLGVLSLAMTCAIALVTDFVFGSATAIVTSSVVALAFTSLWFLLPLRRRRQG